MKEKKNRKLKGSVLLTVISVMALLIIFMSTTLILANAANNRAHKSYATSQAEYTARSAIEAFAQSMSDRPAIEAAVKGLTTAVYPEITIGDAAGNTTSMGQIGYYDASGTFQAGHIAIEPVPGADQWVYGLDSAGDAAPKWFQVKTVRITATARVGREEKTVSAYIRKRPASAATANKLKGLQTAGGGEFGSTQGTFTGDLVLGATNAGTMTYSSGSGTNLKTMLTFINGSLDATTGTGLNIEVKSNECQTIILGDVTFQNNDVVNIDYSMTGDFTTKEIPFLYVDGKIKSNSNSNTYFGGNGTNKSESPYNIYCGSMEVELPYIHGDLYLMDSDKESSLGWTTTGGGALYNWVNSTYNKTDNPTKSIGGSIYCNGDLKMKKMQINGDLRVAGNLTVDPLNYGDLTINGNLVVGGQLTLADASKLKVNGNIYCDNAGAGAYQPKAGYDPFPLDPVEITDNAVKASYGMQNWEIYAYFDPLDGHFLGSGGNWYHQETKYGYYTDPDDNIVTEAEATEYVGTAVTAIDGKAVQPLSAMSAINPGYTSADIYPSNMTREAIWGDPTIVPFKPADVSTKIVKTLEEVQKNLSYDIGTGGFNTAVYPKTCTETISTEVTPGTVNSKLTKIEGAEFTALDENNCLSKDGGKPDYKVTDSIKLGGGTYESTFYIDSTGSDIWIELTGNVNFQNNTGFVVKQGTGHDVYFFIDGGKTLSFNGGWGGIRTNTYYDGAAFRYDHQSSNVTIYGGDDSVLKMSNNEIIMASIKAPYTSIDSACTTGPATISYTDEFGNTYDLTPAFIGNVLCKGVKGSNNFTLAYTEAGAGGGGGGIAGATEYWDIAYLAEY